MPSNNESWLAESPWALALSWGTWSLGCLFTFIGVVTINVCYFGSGECFYDQLYGYIGLCATGFVLGLVGSILLWCRRYKRKRMWSGKSTFRPIADPTFKVVREESRLPLQTWDSRPSTSFVERERPYDPYATGHQTWEIPRKPLPTIPGNATQSLSLPRPAPGARSSVSSLQSVTLGPVTEETIRRQHIDAFLASKEFRDQIERSVALAMREQRGV